MVKKNKKITSKDTSGNIDVVIREIFNLREHTDARLDDLNRKFDKLQTAVDN